MRSLFMLAALGLLLTLTGRSLSAQILANDSTFTGLNYANDVYYSFKDGTVKTVDRNEWDLAFQVEAFEAGLRVNEMKGFELYLIDESVDNWELIEAKDTAGKLTPANRLYNSDSAWSYGAFNAKKVRDDDTDYGWGKYDMGTHQLRPDKMFYLKFPDKSVRKARVLGIKNGFKLFQLELQGLNPGDKAEILEFNRENYKGKNFGYYSFQTQSFKDLEPANTEWDLVFTRYNASVQGQKYPVMGVLTNNIFTRATNTWRGVQTAEVRGEANTTEDFASRAYSNQINLIGSDWKEFSLQQNQWLIPDSLTFFVKAVDGAYWKLVFTGFTGRGKGGSLFYKKLMRPASRENHRSNLPAGICPNPSRLENGTVFVVPASDFEPASVQVFDLAGKDLLNARLDEEYAFSIDALPAGTYLIKVSDVKGNIRHAKLILN